MWEICISCNKSNADTLNKIRQYLNSYIDEKRYFITYYNDKHFSYMLIAADTSVGISFYDYIRKSIIDYIVNVYKFTYIKNRLIPSQNLMQNSYIKALSLFDSDCDEENLYDLLKNSININVDSFLAFRLFKLKSRWNELCDLARDNVVTLSIGNTYNEVIKFLVNNMESKTQKVSVFSDGDKYKLEYISRFKSKEHRFFIMDNLDLIGELIKLCPERIEFYTHNTKNNEVLNILSGIYEKKLQIIEN